MSGSTGGDAVPPTARGVFSGPMVEGLGEHVERHLGPIAGTWDTDPDGNELPFQIVHY